MARVTASAGSHNCPIVASVDLVAL
ncbi:uncharacterized protein G2W53_038257 [Senna tora]|uniref:Uncharacterized protein n=1 Tax=Senna tora TaxID=362788 RepID=A0A834SMN4_9FABA|nr:uncharacterized protein G2W53_038257 [Senna tora]